MDTVRITRCPSRPYEFHSPFAEHEYALLLCVFAQDVTPEEQRKISESIVSSGCRYAVCYGSRCSTWDDSIDTAQLNGDEQPGSFVMTTWHENE